MYFKRADKLDTKHCPCCGYLTVAQENDICGVCYYEVDWKDLEHPTESSGPNNGLTLIEMRKNYEKFGACEKEFIDRVRSPQIEESPREIHS